MFVVLRHFGFNPNKNAIDVHSQYSHSKWTLSFLKSYYRFHARDQSFVLVTQLYSQRCVRVTSKRVGVPLVVHAVPFDSLSVFRAARCRARAVVADLMPQLPHVHLSLWITRSVDLFIQLVRWASGREKLLRRVSAIICSLLWLVTSGEQSQFFCFAFL